MKKIIIVLSLAFTLVGCASFNAVVMGHPQQYDKRYSVKIIK